MVKCAEPIWFCSLFELCIREKNEFLKFGWKTHSGIFKWELCIRWFFTFNWIFLPEIHYSERTAIKNRSKCIAPHRATLVSIFNILLLCGFRFSINAYLFSLLSYFACAIRSFGCFFPEKVHRICFFSSLSPKSELGALNTCYVIVYIVASLFGSFSFNRNNRHDETDSETDTHRLHPPSH